MQNSKNMPLQLMEWEFLSLDDGTLKYLYRPFERRLPKSKIANLYYSGDSYVVELASNGLRAINHCPYPKDIVKLAGVIPVRKLTEADAIAAGARPGFCHRVLYKVGLEPFPNLLFLSHMWNKRWRRTFPWQAEQTLAWRLRLVK